MKRFLIGITVIPLLVFTACSSLNGGSPQSQPDVSSYQYLHMTLTGLIKAGYDDEKLALTHEQAQKIIVLVQKWKTGYFALNKTEAKAVYDSVSAVLTPDQRAWRPQRQPAARGDNGQANSGPPPQGMGNGKMGGGPPGGSPPQGGPGGGQRPLLTADYQKLFDELIDQLGLI